MAMFWLALIPSLVFLAYQVRKVRRITKHDRVLYRFCDLRRRVMAFLRDHGEDLSHDDYRSVRQLIWILGGTIHEYEDFKRSIFNFRILMRRMKSFQASARLVKEMRTDHETIRGFYRDFDRSLLNAMFAYTPLLRSELLAKATVGILFLVGTLGMKAASRVAMQLDTTLSITIEARHAA